MSLDFSLEHRAKLGEELKRADAVVLTYSCDSTNISRPITFWLHELRRLEVYSSGFFAIKLSPYVTSIDINKFLAFML